MLNDIMVLRSRAATLWISTACFVAGCAAIAFAAIVRSGGDPGFDRLFRSGAGRVMIAIAGAILLMQALIGVIGAFRADPIVVLTDRTLKVASPGRQRSIELREVVDVSIRRSFSARPVVPDFNPGAWGRELAVRTRSGLVVAVGRTWPLSFEEFADELRSRADAQA
jgi:hypothetical protein